jgi:hypothetical protein
MPEIAKHGTCAEQLWNHSIWGPISQLYVSAKILVSGICEETERDPRYDRAKFLSGHNLPSPSVFHVQ